MRAAGRPDCVWSLQPADHPQSRQRLVALLPGLLQRLRSGMALVAQPAEEIVGRMREEVIQDTPTLPAFSDSLIDLASMQTVPAGLLAPDADAPAEAGKRVDALTTGERRRLFLRGGWAPVQLLRRSDKGLFFPFAGVQAGATHSITRRALERLDAADLMKPLEDGPIVQRALDALDNPLSLPA